jgi:hypothetical protein
MMLPTVEMKAALVLMQQADPEISQLGTEWLRRLEERRRPLELRNSYLAQMAEMLLPGGRPSSQAALIRQQLDRYEASGWRHDRRHDRCPRQYLALAPTVRALMWGILKIDGTSLSARQIRKILAPFKGPNESPTLESANNEDAP